MADPNAWIISSCLLMVLIFVGFYILWPAISKWRANDTKQQIVYGKYGIFLSYLVLVTYICLMPLRNFFKK